MQFDLLATGHQINTGWVGQGTGLLVDDHNHDGIINNGSELFGTATMLANGQKASTGYQALTAMDTNNDGVISNADQGFSDLKIWVNAYDPSQPEQLLTLAQRGIASLDLAAITTSEKNNGNWIGLQSSYTTTSGATHAMADVWFVTLANTVTTAEAAVLTTSQVAGLATGDNQTLQTRVTALAQALTTFDSSTLVAVNSPVSLTTNPLINPQSTATGQTIAANVDGLANTLQQFNTSVNLTIVSASPPLGNMLLVPNIQDASKTGILSA